MSSRAQKFAEGLKAGLVSKAPGDLLLALSTDRSLYAQVEWFGRDVVGGLEEVQARTETSAGLLKRLQARKSAVVAVAPSKHYTIEKLLSEAIEQTIAEARAIESGR